MGKSARHGVISVCQLGRHPSGKAQWVRDTTAKSAEPDLDAAHRRQQLVALRVIE
ncbi:Uncharacterised protein [Klebsiella pneumoniae]|nr:Uncharacterised protein [Klebsiella pneumoniae]